MINYLLWGDMQRLNVLPALPEFGQPLARMRHRLGNNP
jgi:hypothetical protein